MIPTLRFLLEESALKMIIGTCLFLIIFATYINISYTDTIFPENITPFSLSSSSSDNASYFVGIVMIDNSDNVVAMINERDTDWNNQSSFILSLAEPPEYVNILVNPHRNYAVKNTQVIEFGTMRAVPYEKMTYVSNVSPYETTFIIRPDQIRNYYGIEFKMQNVTRKVSESEISLSLPLKQYNNTGINGYHEVKNLFFQVIPPKNFETVYAFPEMQIFRLIGKHYGAYEFDCDTDKTDLFLLLQNRFIARDLQIMEIILGMLLSLSTCFIATGFIELAAPIHEAYKDKYKDMKMMLFRKKRF